MTTRPKVKARGAASLRKSRTELSKPSAAGKRSGMAAGPTNVLSPRKKKTQTRARYSVMASVGPSLPVILERLSPFYDPLSVAQLLELLAIQCQRFPAMGERFRAFYKAKDSAGVDLYREARETTVLFNVGALEWFTKATGGSAAKALSLCLAWAVEDYQWLASTMDTRSRELQLRLPFDE